MKHFLSLAVLTCALTSSAAFAQLPSSAPAGPAQVQPRAKNPHKAAMRISRQLGLSPDQTAKIEPILADRQQKVQAIRGDASLTDPQRRQQLKAIHQSERMQLSNVLTPDQMKALAAMRHNHAKAAGTPAGV